MHGFEQTSTTDLPLSAAQLGVWYALKAGASMPAFNIAEYVRIAGPIDPALFEAALRQLVLETEASRIRFVERDDVPRQVIGPRPDWCLTFQDVSGEPDPVAAAEAWMHADISRPLDLSSGPFFRFALFRAGAEEFLWYLRYHHLVMDAYGGSLLVRRVAEIYSALAAGLRPGFEQVGSVPALVAEDSAYRASGHFEADRQYWLEMMSGCPEPPSLGLHSAPPSAQFLRATADLPAATTARLQEFAQRAGLSFPQAVTLAAAIFIHRLTEAEDVVLGQMMAARMSPVARQTPAMAMNVVPLRLEMRPDMRVEDLAVQVRRKLRAGLRHQRYRVADLRRDLRRIDRPVIRQFVSVRPFDTATYFAGARATTVPISNGPVDDLNIHVVNDQSEEGGWRVEFDANPALYDQAMLTRLQRRFLHLLASLKDPADVVGRLDILPPDERREILVAWNATRSAYPHDRHVDDLFAEQARRTPDRVAVACGRQRLTYRELNEKAEDLARHLSSLGVRPGDRVALHVERSADMVAALLGILKADGAYVPLDPNYPQERLALILADSTPRVLVSELGLRGRLDPQGAAILCLDSLPPPPAETAPVRPAAERRGGEPAYVLYTSGSTGRPKGVQIPHRALVNFLTAMRHEPGITADDTLLAVTSLSFDIAALELFLPLIVGAQVTIAPAAVAADGVRLAALLQECAATIMQATPATWRLLLEAGWAGSRTLRILCGGEAWTPELAGELLPRCASLWNMYGPTETTVWSAVARIGRDQPVLIGPPIANTRFYVVDRHGQPVPVGVPGELCIGGDGVADGYLNRPDLTAERFAADPFSDDPAARMYRTGDRVRSLADGRLEFLGRLDHQVKIRGFRVELGEIETILRSHPAVLDAVVVVRDDHGERRLAGYVTASGAEPVPVGSLRDLLRRKLPPYMMPDALVTLAALPLTPNGKIDRKALPAPDDRMRRDAGAASVGPRTPLEELLAGLWCESLHLKQVSIHDNFFDLGGDSLAMLRLSLEIERATGRNFPLPWIYDAPTVAGMAEILAGRKAASGYSPLVLLRPGAETPPVFLIHPVGGSTQRLMPIAKSLPGRQPVYGLQARGFDGMEAPFDRVEAMADCYVDAILSVQPRGPYVLAGMCFGGLVAMEVARRLMARGEPIGLLAFLDTYPHPRFWPLRFRFDYLVLRRIREAWAALRASKREEIISYLASRIAVLLRKGMGTATGSRSFVKAPDSLPPAVKAVFGGGIAALETYRPHYYPGTVSYLMCGYHTYLPDGPASAWRRLVGRLEVHCGPRAYDEDGLTNAEYVANWLSDRMQGAPERDVKLRRPAPQPERLDYSPSSAASV